METSNLLKGICGLAAATMVLAPIVADAKPRRILVSSDGTSTDLTATSTTTTTSTTSTTTSTSTSTSDPNYYSTLSPDYTPGELFFGGRKWRTNAGSTWAANMPHSVRFSSSGARIRFEIRSTDYDRSVNDDSGTRRAELSGSVYGDSTRLPNGQSLWGAFSTRHAPWADPEGMKALKGGVYGQIHMGKTFGGSPAVAFRRRADGAFRITTRGEFDTLGTTRYVAPLAFGEVHDVVYNVVLHPTAGSLRVWINGTQVVNVSNVSIGHSSAESYWNFGTYFAAGVTSPVIAEFANHVYPAGTSLSTRVTSRPAWPSN